MKNISDFKNGLNGIEFLRDLVTVFDTRMEHLNGDKDPIELVNEFLKILNEEQDIYGNKLK